MATPDGSKTILNKLGWVLSLTRLGLAAERAIRAFWPLWSVLFLAVSLLMMGVQDRLSVEAVWGLGFCFCGAALWLLVRGVLQMRWPSRDEAFHRLDETLPGRPLQSLVDQPAMGKQDPITQSIWQAHQVRMAEQASAAKAPEPDLRLARFDPFGLRHLALIALSVALLFGSFGRLTSLSAMAPGGRLPTISGASWEGWIEPPAYTGLPTLYLNDQSDAVLDLPENSRVVLRLYGEIGALTVQETVSARLGDVPSAAAPEQDFVLRQSGDLSIAGEGGRSWQIDLQLDQAPVLTSIGTATTSGRGEMSLPYDAMDDHGVVGGTAIVRLDLPQIGRRHGLRVAPENTDPMELQLPLPIRGSRADFQEVLIEDFSDHVWAHLPVTIELIVQDAALQSSLPQKVAIALPARRFFDPLANAVIEQRRDLLWSRENGPRVVQLLRAISHNPQPGLFRKDSDYLRFRSILHRLEAYVASGLTIAARDEITQDLWALALALEEGNLGDAIERMARAQERLAEAIKNGASDEEIARLMQELREATQDYMRQLAQRNTQQGNDTAGQQQSENALRMTQDDLQRMMDRIQELMEQGRMAEAQQALKEFQELMENMQVTEGGEGQPSPGQQALDELGDTLRQQQGLSDQAFRQLQEQFNPNAQAGQSQGNEGSSGGQGRGEAHDGTGGTGQGQSQGENGSPGQEGPQQGGTEGALSDQQQALRQELERQRQNLPRTGSPEGDAAREALGRAGEAMDGAEQALRENDLAEAIDQQAEAMDALREGMRSLGDALAQNQSGQSDGQGRADNQSGQNNDPLGRNQGNGGQAGTDQGLLQGEDVYRRARDLLDEIRRRAGETDRSDQERGYLKRLLDRF
ncbi:TIGR02302 family protein [Cognatishimia sp. WU-CL00825]|uniref:TIGR02302 family protein n=1 Tax=Cognatishimia sp. WU-CL00825 TaxID=3127658 RepID=UPI003103C37B